MTGPHTNVSATLSLQSNSVRMAPALDAELKTDYVGMQSIATSTAQGDSGTFTLNFNDERYLPFEGAGVISQWVLELSPFRQFDYGSISDIILSVSYCALEGDASFKNDVVAQTNTMLDDWLQETGASGMYRAFSLRHDFPNAFHQFMHPPAGQNSHVSTLDVVPGHFPLLFKNDALTLENATVFVVPKDESQPVGGYQGHLFAMSNGNDPNLLVPANAAPMAAFGDLVGEVHAGGGTPATGAWTLVANLTTVSDSTGLDHLISNGLLDPALVEDVFIVFGYRK